MKTKLFAKRILASSIAAAAAVLGSSGLHAEDVDIFTASTTAPKANVLIILDNSSNWNATLGTNSCAGASPYPANTSDNTKFSAEVCALYKVIGSLGPDIRVGLMLFSETGENGGYVRHGMRSMTDANKLVFQRLLSTFIANGANSDTSGSNQPYGRVMYEAFKYFGGYTSVANAASNVAGSPVSRTAFGFEAYAGGGSSNSSGAHRLDAANNNTPADRAAKIYGAVSPFAMLDKNDNVYNAASAITDDCSKNFIIFISNGNPSSGGDSGGVATANQLLANVYPGTTPPVIKSGGVEVHASKMDEFAKFLWETDVSSRPGQQRVSTFTFAVYQPRSDGTASTTDQQMINLMKSAADNGGGQPFAVTSAAQLETELLKVLNDVQAVNSVFVSSSLPVSVNTQGTFLNQVYMGLFRPDATASPRWLGNLKQYKFIQNSTGELFLGDARDIRAVNDANGFISPSAVSFWTSPSTFWVNNLTGTPPSASDSPDGDMVEKGGTAEQQRIDYAVSQGSRKMLTCTGACIGAPIDFNTSNITGAAMQTAFGAASAAELTAIVNWVRGEDNINGTPCNPAVVTVPLCLWTSKEKGPGWPTTVRASIHGDVLHSRPVVLNYASTGPHIFYGANDGMLRAVKGGQNATDGHELWSFVAPEFYSKFKRLRDASPELRTPATPAALISSTLPKDYFFDGPIGSYESGTTKWLFVGARRGGAVIYAIDVTDPASPVILWKKTQAELSRLGQSWSLPWAFRKTGATDPFLIFGAGYDIGEDNATPTDNGVGRGIYVLNARTGDELRFINSGSDTVTRPIASDMALLSTKLVIDNEKPESGVYRSYVGDLGGNVWRLDIPGSDVNAWKLFKLAALGSDRKFLYAPDVVHAGDKDVVLVGSGDREKPLMTTSQDSFYALFDTASDIAVATSITTITPTDLTLLTSLTTPVTSTHGWYRNMAVGEKVINSPLTVAGVSYFATNKPTPPAPGVCNANLGEARAYAVTFNAGAPPDTASGPGTTLSTVILGGGLPPSAIGGVVDLGNGKTVAFVIGAGDKPPEPKRVTLTIPKTRKKVYWNTKSDM